jgi:hypothetical protein
MHKGEIKMNERIIELALQAGLQLGTVLENYTTPIKTITIEQRKFAELIVNQCAELVDRAISDGGVDGRVVKEHFGVE